MISEEEKFDYVLETERLIIRPLQENDYRQWLEGFNNKLPSKHKYDDNKIDTSKWTRETFHDVVKKTSRIV
ncbi:hypothetical protein JOD45_001876 [Scopulibacillus daqui]|uniref:Acetyltransferase (GNAT) family protein n=1 Tax=Scopulibacillus daqui TaxID=1469162 RepID=A0ABS2Q028_9BACL|nr:hypothetical protein [Scopulibacillus daqui]